MKIQEVVDQFLIDGSNRGHAEGTLPLYRRVLGLLVRWFNDRGITELESVTLPLLRQFLHFLLTSDSSERFPDTQVVRRGKLSPVTVGTYVSVVKAFFNWCVDEDLLVNSPAARLSKPKAPKKVVTAFTPEHLERMLGACDTETPIGFRNYVMLLLLLDTGIRVSELCGLRVSDVHPRYIKVLGKGMREREIGMHPEVSKLLWKYINRDRVLFGVESDRVFLGLRGPLTIAGVEAIFAVVKARAGIADMRVSPHVMRHTFSKLYLKNGGDLFKLSRELGHSSVQITGSTYLGDFKSSDARDDHDRYSPLTDTKLIKKRGRKAKNSK